MNKPNTLFYKGIDGFTSEHHYEILQKAADSSYRWWFEYLRLSKDYWWLCKQKGKTLDPEFKKVWLAFGDVFEVDFAQWFIKRGYAIFQQSVAPPKIEVVDDVRGMRVSVSYTKNRILLAVPTDISEKTLKKQFVEIIRAIENREVRKGKADFSLLKVKGVRKQVLEKAHGVWCERFKQSYMREHQIDDGKKLDMYEIGERLAISPAHNRRTGEHEKDRNLKERVMRVAVNRMYHRAEALIANAEVGRFPSYESVTVKKKRWTKEQQAQLDKAVESGKWMPPPKSEINWRQLGQRYFRQKIW
jgi:hypothetical protein